MASETVLKIFDDLKELHNAKDSDYAGEGPHKCRECGDPLYGYLYCINQECKNFGE